MMAVDPQSLGDVEQEGIKRLEPEYKDHMTLAEAAFNAIGAILNEVPEVRIDEMSQSVKVALALLIRLSNDLRCAALVAIRGYPLQAASHAASMLETAYAVAAIGSDEALAQRWIDHDDPTQPFMKVRELISEALRKLGLKDRSDLVDVRYRDYRQLCWAKHANPLLQKLHGFEIKNGRVLSMNGPDTSESAIRVTWFALEHGVGLTLVALGSFASNHLSPSAARRIEDRLASLSTGRETLSARAKARWGTEDPFKGKW